MFLMNKFFHVLARNLSVLYGVFIKKYIYISDIRVPSYPFKETNKILEVDILKYPVKIEMKNNNRDHTVEMTN